MLGQLPELIKINGSCWIPNIVELLSGKETATVFHVGDGDSSAFKSVQNEHPYGSDVYITKKDCVGHIQKRMGTGLRNMVACYKGHKLVDGKGIGGRGRLTK